MSRDVLATHPRLRLAIYRTGTAVARTCPLWAGRLLAWLAGTLAWAFDPHGRAVVRRNLAHFIPAACRDARERAVRRSYVAFCCYLFESFRLDRLPPWFFGPDRLRHFDPCGVFSASTPRGPAILVTVHCNWELASAALKRLGWIDQVQVVVLPSGDPRIDAIFERQRNAVGARSLPLDRAPLGTLRALRAGGTIGLVGDRDYRGTGMPVPFAGETMTIPIGPAALAVQTGAPIIPVLLARRGLTRFDLLIGRPLRANPDAAKGSEVERLTTELAGVLARFIAAAPAQWVAFHPAWGQDGIGD